MSAIVSWQFDKTQSIEKVLIFNIALVLLSGTNQSTIRDYKRDPYPDKWSHQDSNAGCSSWQRTISELQNGSSTKLRSQFLFHSSIIIFCQLSCWSRRCVHLPSLVCRTYPPWLAWQRSTKTCSWKPCESIYKNGALWLMRRLWSDWAYTLIRLGKSPGIFCLCTRIIKNNYDIPNHLLPF